MRLNCCLFIFCSLLAVQKYSSADETQFSIVPNKAVQLLDERFVSFTIDPSVFFIGLSEHPVTTSLIKHLLPAYLRIAGASTSFLEFTVDEDRTTKVFSDDATTLAFSPAMWWSLNEWLHRTNFTPIFALNDQDRSAGKWDAKGLMPLLDMTAKMNINCDWQLGFDCSDKGFEQYKEDLTTLRHVLDMYPTKKGKWRVVGSDLSKCVPSDHTDILRMYLADLHDVDALMWANDETLATSSSFLAGDVMLKLLSFHPANLPVWISIPKAAHPITFGDAMEWAVEMGEAARNGFGVIFREPRLQEFYSATPVYWTTVLHKRLMGRNVLDVKTTSLVHSTSAYVYAHCSRDQNSFPVRGAMTVMIANNGSDTHRASLRFPQQVKSVEVRTYILTGKGPEMDTYLNGEKLDLDAIALRPQQRRAKVLTHLTLTVPPRGIGFFVLPGVRIPVCINEEDDTALVLEEIERIRSVEFAESAKSADLTSRLSMVRNSLSLIDLRRKLEDELRTDAMLIPKLKLRIPPPLPPAARSAPLVKRPFLDDRKQPMAPKIGAKPTDVQLLMDKVGTKAFNLKNLLKKEEEADNVFELSRPKLELGQLSSAEVLKILGDRAKAKLERKVGLADFDGIFDKTLRAAKFKRDINMDLLEEKVHAEEQKAGGGKLRKKVDADSDGLPEMSKIIPGHAALSPFSMLNAKPKLDPLDLTAWLVSLKGRVATTTATPITSPATSIRSQFSNLDDYSKGFATQIDELEDNLQANHFFEHFGDSVQIHPKSFQHADSDLTATWGTMDDDRLQHEFIVNDGDVQGAIGRLEDYFNQPSPFGQTPIDTFDAFGRFKRRLRKNQHYGLPSAKKSSPTNLFANRTAGRGWKRPAAQLGINRKRRRVDGSIDSVENAIDDFLQPVLDRASGEYTLVFPSHDKMSLVQQRNGDSQIVVHHEQRKPDADSVESKTCRADELYTSTEGLTLGKFLVGLRNSIAKDNKSEKRTERSDFIQRIPPKAVTPATVKDDPGSGGQLEFLYKLKNGFSKIMRNLRVKVEHFFKCIE